MRARKKDKRVVARVGRGDPILNANLCSACGASNPTLFADTPPTSCDICGTPFESEALGRKAFQAKQFQLGGEGVVRFRAVDNLHRTKRRFRPLKTRGLRGLEGRLTTAGLGPRGCGGTGAR